MALIPKVPMGLPLPGPLPIARSPMSDVLQPTGGYVNPLVDYSTSLGYRLRNLGTSRLDVPAQMASQDLSFGPTPTFFADYIGSQWRNRIPNIDIRGATLYNEPSTDSLRELLEHELIHALLEDVPDKRGLRLKLLQKPSVLRLLERYPRRRPELETMDLDQPLPIHTLTALMGRGGRGQAWNRNIRYLEDVPEDIQPFAEGFYPRRVR